MKCHFILLASNVICAITGCTHSQGYWKSKLNSVYSTDPIVISNVRYDKYQMRLIFNEQPRGNGLTILGHQLVAAKLNIAHGASSPDAIAAICTAEELINGRLIPPLGDGYLNSAIVEQLNILLTAFNEGKLGSPSCELDCIPSSTKVGSEPTAIAITAGTLSSLSKITSTSAAFVASTTRTVFSDATTRTVFVAATTQTAIFDATTRTAFVDATTNTALVAATTNFDTTIVNTSADFVDSFTTIQPITYQNQSNSKPTTSASINPNPTNSFSDHSQPIITETPTTTTSITLSEIESTTTTISTLIKTNSDGETSPNTSIIVASATASTAVVAATVVVAFIVLRRRKLAQAQLTLQTGMVQSLNPMYESVAVENPIYEDGVFDHPVDID